VFQSLEIQQTFHVKNKPGSHNAGGHGPRGKPRSKLKSNQGSPCGLLPLYQSSSNFSSFSALSQPPGGHSCARTGAGKGRGGRRKYEEAQKGGKNALRNKKSAANTKKKSSRRSQGLVQPISLHNLRFSMVEKKYFERTRNNPLGGIRIHDLSTLAGEQLTVRPRLAVYSTLFFCMNRMKCIEKCRAQEWQSTHHRDIFTWQRVAGAHDTCSVFGGRFFSF